MIHFFDIEDKVVREYPKNIFPIVDEDGNETGFLENEKYCKPILSYTEEGNPIYGSKIDSIEFDSNKIKEEILNECLAITRLKTRNKIYEGFTFTLNEVDITFKYDEQEQANWSALAIVRSSLEYPYSKRDKSRTNIAFNTEQEILDCYLAGLNYVSNTIKDGNDIEDNLYACTTVPQMRSVVSADNR